MADGQQPAINPWHWVGYALVIAVLVILAANGFLFIFWNHITDPKVFIAITLVSLFVLATTTTLAIIFLWGAGILKFESGFINWLGGATVAEVAGILTIIINFYFAGGPAKAPQVPAPAPAVQQQTQGAPPEQPAQQVQAPPKTQPAPPAAN